ncbi:MAG: hypothetical protein JXJ22_00005 [Bacteroidales bacterium]|nr:hypothetical protein [Bacteroidales bacterium]
MKKESFLLIVLLCAIALMSCEDNNTPNLPKGYKQGIFIVNEGSFGQNNGSISYYNPDSMKMYNNLFYTVNNRPLGDVIQSMGVTDDFGYIVVNGSGKVEVVDLETFETVRDPLIVNYPRYFLKVSDSKGYLSSGSMEGKVYVIDTDNSVITDSISVGMGPEHMILLDNYVYVANSGGWSNDSTLSVIDVATDEVIDTIVVADGPMDLVADADNNLWVQCRGYAVYNWDPPYNVISETEARLVKINTSQGMAVWSAVLGNASDYTATYISMATNTDKTKILFLKPSGIFSMGKEDVQLPSSAFILGNFSGIDVHPVSDDIYTFQSSYTANGEMKIYNSSSELQKTFEAGIGPNSAVFNK